MTRALPAILVAVVGCGCSSRALVGEPDAGDDAGHEPARDVPHEECPDRVGHCTSSDDCGGRPCVRFPDEPGAWHFCETVPRPVSHCGEYMDECCSDDECTEGLNGICTRQHWTCGFGYWYHSRCAYDECSSDEDCEAVGPDFDSICMPAQISPWSRSYCIRAYCKVDADCTRLPCGQCRPALMDCCSDGDCCVHGTPGLHCAYPSVCLDNSDCTGSEICYAGWDGDFFCDTIPCLL